MHNQDVELLRTLANKYHNKEFIAADPISLPHRYTHRQDIEIIGLLAAIMSFGNRKQILKKGNVLCQIFGSSPSDYLCSGRWKSDFRIDDTTSFYRTLSHQYFYLILARLNEVYNQYDSLEDCLITYSHHPMKALCRFLEVSDKSPQKKLNMFLRWMIRTDSPVDFGLWTRYSPADLLIPLDTHVLRMSRFFGLTDKNTPSLSNTIRITDALKTVFPGDPCLGDFALFGYGIEHKGLEWIDNNQ